MINLYFMMQLCLLLLLFLVNYILYNKVGNVTHTFNLSPFIKALFSKNSKKNNKQKISLFFMCRTNRRNYIFNDRCLILCMVLLYTILNFYYL